jgi:hypothetical protein
MVNAPKIKRKDVNMEELGEKLLKFVQENSPEKMELDLIKAKKAFVLNRNIIFEAYALGPEELKKYKIVEGKTPSPLKEVDPPCLSGKGTITIKKYYVDEYNEKYSDNKITQDSSFDVAFEDGKIILTKN